MCYKVWRLSAKCTSAKSHECQTHECQMRTNAKSSIWHSLQWGAGVKPHWGVKPPLPQGLGRRPNNCSQATWVGVRRTPTQVAPTGQAVRVMVRHVRVMVRHVYIVPLESSHVEYP